MAADGEGSSTSMTTVKFPVHGFQMESVWNDGVHSQVKGFRIVYASKYIWSVHIEYINKDGETKWGPIHGRPVNPDFTKSEFIKFASPTEYLTSIHGSIGDKKIDSLSFETNKGQTYGPYGDDQNATGTKFSIPLRPAKIVGFHGWSDRDGFLTAIGLYVQPITETMPQPQPQPKPDPQPQPKADENCFSLGQYGNEDGEYWVENFRAMKRLIICSDEEWIISIQMDYEDENGNIVSSKKHGGDGGSENEVVLEDADEYLITIKGYYDNSLHSESDTNKIRSLTVITNNAAYGPYGVEDGTEFSFPTNARLKVVGIHGRSDLYLNAIGLNVVRVRSYY